MCCCFYCYVNGLEAKSTSKCEGCCNNFQKKLYLKKKLYLYSITLNVFRPNNYIYIERESEREREWERKWETCE